MATRTEKSELVALQKENTTLRGQLKDLGNKLNDLIDLRDAQKKQKRPTSANPEDELKEALKMIEIYKKEKHFLEKRLKKALDLEYFNKLTSKVENDTKLLNSTKNTQKLAELFDKKENSYKQSPIKSNEQSEFDLLNSKRQFFINNISKIQESIEKNSVLAEENEKKIKKLEMKQKKMLETLGEPYLRERSMKQMLDAINKKKRVEKLIQRETNSKVNVMMNKIKGLQVELKALKESEEQMSSQIINASRQVAVYNEKILFSPIRNYGKNTEESRSHSVKPHLHKTFLTNY